jgi:acyl-CoA synthetase (AMP-forming)/AMP-acid ligase II
MSADTIGELIRARATLGQHAMLVADHSRLSYADAEKRSGRMAAALLAAAVGRGSRVALLFGNTAEFVVSFLAITRIGAIALPLSTMSTAHELGGLLAGSDAQYLVSADFYRGRALRQVVSEALEAEPSGLLKLSALPTLRRIWFGIGELEQTTQDKRVAAAEAEVWAADPMIIVHTSGSTGAPKGVLHTHGQVLRNMRRQNVLRNYSGEDRLFSNSPFFWIGGLVYSLLATITAGARLICSSAPAAEQLALLEKERPTMTNGVSTTALGLARDPSFAKRDLASMRRGNLYPIMPLDVRPADPELRYNMLGMTETGSVCFRGSEEDLPECKRGSFGSRVEGIETRLVEPDTGADSDAGELWVRGANVMQGYDGRERWQCFDANGWYHTGDMMTVDADGDYYFKGRTGDIIRTSGAQVSPREVEGAISEATGGQTSIVIGLPDPERGHIVAAVLVGDSQIDLDALRTALAQKLSPYKVPRRFVTMAENQLPTKSSGKVDIKTLVDRVRELS